MTEQQQFVTQIVTPMLWPGEQVVQCGVVYRESSVGARLATGGRTQIWWFAAVTDQRIILINVPMGVLGPKCENKGVTTIELRHVVSAQPGAYMQSRSVNLELLGGGWQKLEMLPEAKGFPQQPQFCDQFPQWLQQQVQSGVHLDQAAVEQFRQQQAAATADAMRRDAEQQAKIVAGLKRYGAPAAAGLLAISAVYHGYDSYVHVDGLQDEETNLACLEETIDYVESNRDWIEDQEPPPDDCPEEDFEDEQAQCMSNDVRVGHRNPVQVGYEDVCHLCAVADDDHEASRTDVVYARHHAYWICPDEEWLDRELRDLDDTRAEVEDWRESRNGWLAESAIYAVGSLGLGIAAFVPWVRRWRHEDMP